MKRVNLAVGLASMAAVLCTAAAPAMAHEFTASRLPRQLSEAEPGKTKGVGIGSSTLGGEERSQELKFGAFSIDCAAKTSADAISEGAVSWATSQIFATEVKFTKCLTKANYGNFVAGTSTKFNFNPETKKTEPVKFVYHVNGFVELGSEEVESEVEVGSGAASFTVGGKVCKISWPAQIVPAKAAVNANGTYSAATYSTKEVPVEVKKIKQFPSGFQDRLVIQNEFKNMAWSYEEGQCLGEGGFEKTAPHEEGKSAIYNGTLEETLNAGNLSFK
jgi:hypothetical protein